MQKCPAAKNLYFIVHVEINYLNKSPATERSKNVISMQNSKSAVSQCSMWFVFIKINAKILFTLDLIRSTPPDDMAECCRRD